MICPLGPDESATPPLQSLVYAEDQRTIISLLEVLYQGR